MKLALRCFLSLGVIFVAGFSLLGQTVRSRIEVLNQELASNPSGGGTGVRQLIETRSMLMSELMKSDPGAAMELALPEGILGRLQNVGLEERGEWSGTVSVVVEDDFEHGVSRTHTTLQADGRTLAIYFAGATPRVESGAVLTVKGLRIGDLVAAAESRIVGATGSIGCSTTGPQTFAFLLLNFASSQIPSNITASYLTSLVSGPGHSIDGYWREASGGLTSATADVYGPFNLGADFTDGLFMDVAIKAASSSVTFQKYNHVVFVLPHGYPTYGGMAGPCQSLNYPATGTFQAGLISVHSDSLAPVDVGVCLLAHEAGHNFGLQHASSESYGSIPLGPVGTVPVHDEYGDLFSTMGWCNGGIGHYAAQHKISLGWLGPSNYQTVTSSGSFALVPSESGTKGLQALRVQRGANNDWLWLEYRQPIGYDSTFASYYPDLNQGLTGALIHFEDPAEYPGYTRLLNFSAPTVPYSFTHAALPSGSSWSDPYSPLTITVTGASASALSVTISYDTPCASPTSTSRMYGSPAAVASDDVSVVAPGTCRWAVGSPPWITVTSGASGIGNGKVTYSVAANTGIVSRTGVLAIGRQNVTITQASSNAPPLPVSVTPGAGSSIAGANQSFQFVFSDGDGASTLSNAGILFNVTSGSIVSACYLYYEASSNSLYMLDDTGSVSPIHLSFGGGTLSNSQCAIDSHTVALASSGSLLTLTIGITFSTSFAGTKNVYLDARDERGADSGFVKLGTWTVNSGFGIAGQVTLAGAPLSGVTIGLTGSQTASATTDSNGNYGFAALTSAGNFVVTPSRSGLSFAPSNASFKGLSGNQSANFAARANSYSIAGQVSLSGNPLSGVTVTLSGSRTGSATTDLSGNYNFTGLVSGGSYVVTPTRSGFGFVPPSASFSGLTGNQTANFAASGLSVAPQLSVAITHTGPFTQGQSASYSIAVSNAPSAGPTSGAVLIALDLPIALVLATMVGDGWNCASNTCTRSDVLAAGSSYPAVTATVAIASSAPASVVSLATVSRGGSASATASDSTSVSGGASGGPAVVSLSPVASAGTSQVFTFQFTHPSGYSNLAVINVLINTALDGRQGCYIAYVQQSNTVILINDAGDAGGVYAGTFILGSGTGVSNGQCSILGAGSSAVGSGTTLTLTLNLAFSGSFGGNRVIYLAARDGSSNNTGWQTMGVHGVPPLPATFPNPVSMNPASGAGASATLTFTYQDVSNATNLLTAWALVNTAVDGRGACYVAYYRPGNLLLLVPDSGDGTQAASMVLSGGTGTLSNSQCTISAQGSSAMVVSNTLMLSLNVGFKPGAFTGPKGVWMATQTAGGVTSPWQGLGAWRVP